MKKIFGTIGIVLICALIACVAAPLRQADAKDITLKYSNFFPPTNRISILCDQWCQEVEKRTGGRVKVNYFPGGALTKPARTYDGVKSRIADIGLTFAGYTRGRFPLTEVFSVPLGIKTGYQGTKTANAYYKHFKPKEFDEVKVLYLHTSPPHHLFAKKQVTKLEDLKGMKIRSGGDVATLVKALGGAPVSMPMSEAYDALSKGVVDGIVSPFEPMKGFRLAEVVNHATIMEEFYAGLAFVVMNKDKWNALPADIQAIIDQINEEWIEKQGLLWDDYDKEGKDYFIEKGGKISTLTKAENARFAELLRPVADAYISRMKEKGLPGAEVYKFCVDYIKAH